MYPFFVSALHGAALHAMGSSVRYIAPRQAEADTNGNMGGLMEH